MKPEQRARVEELLDALLPLSPQDKHVQIDHLCADDPEVRLEVIRLLAAASSNSSPAKVDVSALLNQAAGFVSSACEDLLPGAKFGPYVILEQLGSGGFGNVYKAADQGKIKRVVALKVIKPGVDTKEVLARFEGERQALAFMNHPNIAKLLYAGRTADKRPYFIMEYVPGEPITDFADHHNLTIKDRLQVFQQICEAINHAHQKGIVHRDIKASNVLAYISDGRPFAKVIDFGIAKALTGDKLTDRTLSTQRGAMIGSYEAMSPEQAKGSPDIDTQTDVYSLGLLLYELLVGVKAFDPKALLSGGDAEARRIIMEVDPPRPSVRLGSTQEGGKRVAGTRQLRLDMLKKQLRTELEWIPLMAMRKERSRRYASPLDLGADIQNYLDNRPLKAGPESLKYWLGKFARRNAAMVTLVGMVTIALLSAAGVSTALAIRERSARHRAEYAETRLSSLLADSEIQKAKAIQANRYLDQEVHNSASMHRHLPNTNFDNNSFQDVIQYLKDVTGMNSIRVDWSALESAGISRDAPITARMTDPTLDDTLKQIVRQPSLRESVVYVIEDDGTIILTTPALANKIVVTRGYRDVEFMGDDKVIKAVMDQVRALLGTDAEQVIQSEREVWIHASIEKQMQVLPILEPPLLQGDLRYGSYRQMFN